METGTRRLRRMLLLSACGLGAVVTWTALSLSLGEVGAHASEDSRGLLDGLASAATDAVSEVVDEVVAPVLADAGGVVTSIVPLAVEPLPQALEPVPVVGRDAAAATEEIVGAAVDTVDAVATPVADELGDAPLGAATEPLLESLTGLPVVGVGVDRMTPIVSGAFDGLDAVLGSLGGAVVSAMEPLGKTPVPLPPSESPASPTSVLSRIADPGVRAEAAAVPGTLPRAGAPPGERTGTGGAGPPSSSGPLVVGLPLGAIPPASSAVSGGGPGGAVAVAAEADPSSPRAGERTSGLLGDALPASPSYDTDISPD